MLNIYKRIIQGIVITLGLTAFALATVSAAPNDNRASNKPTTVSATTTADDTTTETATEVTTSNREKAKELLEAKRANRTERSAVQKQKACEKRATNIDKRAANYAKQGQKHLEVFNKIFVKVQAFKTDKQLDVVDYDDLVAAATAKQTAAQDAVDALKELDVSIDCTQADPAGAVATLKAATGTARTALHDYRKSIKDVVIAMKGASTAQKESTTTEENGDTTTDTTAETPTDTTTTEGAQ